MRCKHCDARDEVFQVDRYLTELLEREEFAYRALMETYEDDNLGDRRVAQADYTSAAGESYRCMQQLASVEGASQRAGRCILPKH